MGKKWGENLGLNSLVIGSSLTFGKAPPGRREYQR